MPTLDDQENQLDTTGQEGKDQPEQVKPLLSQEEIDALLSALPGGQADRAKGSTLLNRSSISRQINIEVEKYDFTNPSRLSRDHLKALNAIHTIYARNLSSALSITLRTPVEMECNTIEQMTYGEYLSSLFDPTCIGIFSIQPLKGIGMLEISIPLVFPIIETLLGGSSLPRTFSRGLTVVEEKLISRVMENALSILQESWQRRVNVEMKLERLESNPQFVQAAASGDPVVLILFNVRLQRVNSLMSICFPFLTIQQALEGLRREESSPIDDESRKLYGSLIREHMKRVRVQVSVRYPGSPVTLRELLSLKKGDIITLQNAKRDQVEVLISGRRKFIGKPGMANGRRAVQIQDIYSE